MGHWFESAKQRLYFLVQKAASTVRIVANERSAQGDDGVRHSCWRIGGDCHFGHRCVSRQGDRTMGCNRIGN